MPQVRSSDGTAIGYDRLSADGPVVVLVGGGLDDGTENLPLGERLTGGFAVVNYRRRGRGDSGCRFTIGSFFAGSGRLDFRACEHKSGFQSLQDEVVVIGFPVL